MKLQIQKDDHFLEWDKTKIKSFWNFYGANPIFKKCFAGESLSGALVDFIQKYISLKNKKVLEIGFGTGCFLEKLVDVHAICSGLDYSETNVAEVQKNLLRKNKDIELKNGTIADLPFEDENFDIIFSFEVFEHLLPEDIFKGLSEVNRCLKKNGYIIIVTPYDENLYESMILCPECHSVFHTIQHLQTFDETKMTNLLENNGFKIKMCQKRFFEPIRPIWQSLPIMIYRAVYRKNFKDDKLIVIAQKV